MRLRSGWREDVGIPVEEQGVMLKLAAGTLRSGFLGLIGARPGRVVVL